MSENNSNTAVESTVEGKSTEVVEQATGEVVESTPTGDALAAAITDRAREVMAMSVEDRNAFLNSAAMTRDGVLQGNVHTPTVDLLAAVRVRTDLALDVERSASYQRALSYAHGERHLFLKRGEKNSTKPYTSASDFLIRGLGYPTDSMVTTLKQLAMAIEAGVEDGSIEWKHLVQSGKTRKMVSDTLKAGRNPEAIETARKAIEGRVAINPSGRPADEPKVTADGSDAPASNQGTSNGGPAHEAGQTDPADAARVACTEAIETLRANVGNLTRVAWVSVEDHLTAILANEIERRQEASKAEQASKRTTKSASK